MNFKEIQTRIDELRSELKQVTKISEVIAKFKEMQKLIEEHQQIKITTYEDKKNAIEKLLKEEFKEVEKLVYSVIDSNNYTVDVKLRSNGFENWNSYNRVFHFVPKSPTHDWNLPEKKEHDWKIDKPGEEMVEEYMMGCHPFFGPSLYGRPYPMPKKMMKRYMEMEEKRNLCSKDELDKISLRRESGELSSTASFSSEQIMKDAEPIRAIFGKVLSIMDETDSKIREVVKEYENRGIDKNHSTYYISNLSNILYEFVHSHTFTPGKTLFMVPFLKDDIVEQSPNIVKVTKAKIHMILGEGSQQILVTKDINHVVWHLFENDINSDTKDFGKNIYNILISIYIKSAKSQETNCY